MRLGIFADKKYKDFLHFIWKITQNPLYLHTDLGFQVDMVDVAQSVRVTDCGSEGRGFESHLPPKEYLKKYSFFISNTHEL